MYALIQVIVDYTEIEDMQVPFAYLLNIIKIGRMHMRFCVVIGTSMLVLMLDTTRPLAAGVWGRRDGLTPCGVLAARSQRGQRMGPSSTT